MTNKLPEQARTYIRVIKQMQKQFNELYPIKDFAELVLGVSRSTFESWQPNKSTIDSLAFKKAWERVKTISEIQILMVRIYNNKEAIKNVVVSENTVFEKTFHEIIMSSDIEQLLELQSFLESTAYGK